MSLRSAMRKAAGLLIEIPSEPSDLPYRSSDASLNATLLGDDGLPITETLSGQHSSLGQPRTVEEIVRDAPGPDLDAVKVDETQISAAAPGGILSGGALDFSAIYRAANLPPNAFGAEQMLETLQSLPAELPLETRRATVRAMLSTLGKATGATPETVVADASRKLAALESFESYMARKTTEAVAKTEAEITELEAQIDAKRQTIQRSNSELLKVQTGCEDESDRLDDVLEFFSLDVGASKYAPSAAPDSIPAPNQSA